MRTIAGSRSIASNRSPASARRATYNQSYSLSFLDTLTQRIFLAGNASVSTDIIDSFTVLSLVNVSNRTDQSQANSTVVSNLSASNTTNFSIAVRNSAKTISIIISTGASNQNMVSTARVGSGWNWVGMSHSRNVSLSTIVNKTIETVPTTITAAASAARDFYVGSTNVAGYMHGFIAKTWVFGGVITQNELNRVVDEGTLPTLLTPKLIWNYTEGSGTTINDSSGLGNNGSATAGMVWTNSIIPSKTRTIAI